MSPAVHYPGRFRNSPIFLSAGRQVIFQPNDWTVGQLLPLELLVPVLLLGLLVTEAVIKSDVVDLYYVSMEQKRDF